MEKRTSNLVAVAMTVLEQKALLHLLFRQAVLDQGQAVDPMLLLSSGGWNGKGGEDLAGDVALEAADRFGLGLAVADAFGEVVLGGWIAVQPDERDAP